MRITFGKLLPIFQGPEMASTCEGGIECECSGYNPWRRERLGLSKHSAGRIMDKICGCLIGVLS